MNTHHVAPWHTTHIYVQQKWLQSASHVVFVIKKVAHCCYRHHFILVSYLSQIERGPQNTCRHCWNTCVKFNLLSIIWWTHSCCKQLHKRALWASNKRQCWYLHDATIKEPTTRVAVGSLLLYTVVAAAVTSGDWIPLTRVTSEVSIIQSCSIYVSYILLAWGWRQLYRYRLYIQCTPKQAVHPVYFW